MDARTALTTTRAVRKRLDASRPVPREVLEDCIDIASQAPTGGNRQRLRWILVEDESRRAAVVDAFRDSARDTYAFMRDRARTPASRRAYEGALDLLERLHTIPVFALPCMTGSPEFPIEHYPASAFYGSALPAVWSFQLALRTHGLGSSFTSVHLAREREVGEVLGIPESVRQIALLPVAYTLGTDFRPAKRLPVTELVSYDEWKE